jgi:putative mRNA 3-end processing factor
MCDVYRACGVALPPYTRYESQTFDRQSVVIWPPSRRGVRKALRGRPLYTAMLTGWTVDRRTAFRYGADCGFALSDHADYPALLRYIELAQPKKVLLNHGNRDFVYRLRAMGVEAEYLEEHEQLALF